jgi:hypothetical protein
MEVRLKNGLFASDLSKKSREPCIYPRYTSQDGVSGGQADQEYSQAVSGRLLRQHFQRRETGNPVRHENAAYSTGKDVCPAGYQGLLLMIFPV